MTNVSMEMLSYHTWANQTILGRIKELPSSVLSQELNSSFPTIAHALSHIYAVDQMWYLVLSGMAMGEALQECMPLNGKHSLPSKSTWTPTPHWQIDTSSGYSLKPIWSKPSYLIIHTLASAKQRCPTCCCMW